MRKMILGLAALFCLTVASAQERGQVWMGGSIGFSTSKVDIDGADRTTNFNIMPEVGYQFSDNWAVGIRLGYGRTNDDDLGKIDAFTVNPFARFSFLKGNVGSLFVDGGVGYTYGKVKSTDAKTNMFEVGFRPGVCVNLSQSLQLTGRFGFLGYQHENVKRGDAKVKTNSFAADFDLSQILLGLNFKF